MTACFCRRSLCFAVKIFHIRWHFFAVGLFPKFRGLYKSDSQCEFKSTGFPCKIAVECRIVESNVECRIKQANIASLINQSMKW